LLKFEFAPLLHGMRSRVLVLSGQASSNGLLIDGLKASSDVVETQTIDEAIAKLRTDHFDAIFSDSADFLPLERALVSQQANLILNTIGEGVCIVDGEGRCNWMNKKMQAWPAHVHEQIRRTCQEAFELFSKQVSPQNASDPPAFTRSKRYQLNIEDQQQYMELIASPVISPHNQVVQVVAVVWDATGTRRLQQKIDAIDRAGRELVRLESDALAKMNVGQRLKLLEERIISFTSDLLHFDHFVIRLLERRTGKLEVVISQGYPAEALAIDLYATSELSNGISGYVAATGRSYICPDVERDPRFVVGLDQARSSLTVPLRLGNKVIGIFNIESRQKAAFNEDDRQFAEIFGHYVALALNILDLMVTERMQVCHEVADDVRYEAAGPLNDIVSDANSLIDVVPDDETRERLRAIISNANLIRKALRAVAEGPNNLVLGASDVKDTEDPVIGGSEVLIADDDPKIRETIHDVLRKYQAKVTVQKLAERDFDLVLSDISMPDKTGYDVFAAARRRRESMPVILMTGFGYDPNHSIVRASQEGLQAVLFKPFKVEQLLNEVRKALQAVATR
jgi:CheY-like chemotaxis protein/GAF domain-containing protein